MGNGHAKGAGFERVIAKLIVKAFKKHGIEQRECWRSVMSGGHEMSSGDLYMSDRLAKLFPFAPECKFRRKIRWVNFLLGASEEYSWLDQAESGALKRAGAEPLLIMKENHGRIVVLVPGKGIGTVKTSRYTYRFDLFDRFLRKAVAKGERE
jgi:hypothetical protein